MGAEEPGRETGERFRAGDAEAFRELVEYAGRPVYGLLYRLVLDHQAAEDILQEAFMRCWKARGRFEPDRPFLPWVRRIATNLAMSYLASPKSRPTGEVVIGEDWEPAAPEHKQGKQPMDALMGKEKRRALDRALGELTAERRAVLILRAQENLSYEEIAERLRCPIGTVMSRLYRAREDLRSALERMGVSV